MGIGSKIFCNKCHASCDDTPVLLIYRQRRYQCKYSHTFNEKATFASKSFQSSPRLRQVIFNRLAESRNYRDIAHLCGVSVAQVMRVCTEIHIPHPQTLPRVISIL
ncbi:helix-turn-helix domain-containing protein [Veillonella magna]|uniref:helix-turn-helix domain-containing protein n=1 Tax=Veillonella magna TaxID=464322 RepID=UPI003B96D67F